jgi:hypothetical protein
MAVLTYLVLIVALTGVVAEEGLFGKCRNIAFAGAGDKGPIKSGLSRGSLILLGQKKLTMML